MKFDQAYRREDFLLFLSAFLPNDFIAREEDVLLNAKRCKEIRKAKILGICESLGLQVLELEHDKENDPRITIASDAFKILADHWIRRALVIFKSKNSNNYRLSFLSISLELSEENKVTRRYSNARRYSFYLGPNASVNTPNQFLINQGRVSNIEDLISRFSVEIVTKEFFVKYHDIFFNIIDEFDKNDTFRREVVLKYDTKTSDFVKKLMGQIVFLYFLQRKGWLGVRLGERWGTGDPHFMRSIFESCKQHRKNFYNDYLEPLFYDYLGKADRGNNAATNDQSFAPLFNSRIPYLNGGLFEDVYDWKSTNIEVDNGVFEELLSFFDLYNFTVDENTPSDQEVSVDPEMLGKIFEKLLGIKDRKSMGAYYTPREIVHYMCRESLINYLITSSEIPEERIRKLFQAKDAELFLLVDKNVVPKIQKLAELNEIAEKVDVLLKDIKIVDPAVGSGAFPMGMLSEISSTRHYLNSNFLHKLNNHNKPLSLYDIKRQTLENCIYGVDLDPGAVDIAKLRFWLSLVVDHNIDEIEALPNLDYKIMQGNSLLEEYEGIKLFDEKLLRSPIINAEIFDPKNQHITKLQTELLQFYVKNPLWMQKGIHDDKPNEVVELETNLRNLLTKNRTIEVDSTEQRDLFTSVSESKNIWETIKSKHKLLFSESNKEEKRDLRRQIDDLNWQLIESTLEEQGKKLEIEKLKQLKKSNTKPFFLWRLHFAEVFEERGGFDVVIGNPPYKFLSGKGSPVKILEKEHRMREAQELKQQLDRIAQIYTNSSTGCRDYYKWFIDLGTQLLSNRGVITYITPNTYLSLSSYEDVRILIFKYLGCLNIVDLGFDIFEDPVVSSAIFISQKSRVINSINYSDLKELNNAELKYQGMQSLCEKNAIKVSYQNGKLLLYKNSVAEKIYSQFASTLKDYLIISEGEHSLNNDFSEEFKIGIPVIFDKKLFPYVAVGIKFLPEAYCPNYSTDLHSGERFFIRKTGDSILAVPFWGKDFAIAHQNLYVVKPRVIGRSKLFVALLSSRLLNFLYQNGIYGQKNRIMAQFRIYGLYELPIPDISTDDQKNITDIVDKIFDLTKDEGYLASVEKQLEVKKLGYHIDELVYKLYGLTPEEIETVEKLSKIV